MKYFFETNIDCKACLDEVLMNLVPYSKNGLFFNEKSPKCICIITDSESDMETLRQAMNDIGVNYNIRTEKILNESEYKSMIPDFTAFQDDIKLSL